MKSDWTKGSVSISRLFGGGTDQEIEIRIRDELSRVEFVTIRLSLADFASAVTGQASIEGLLKVRGLNLVGCTHERKEVMVPIPTFGCKDPEVLGPFEVDGWKARRGDLGNQHNIVSMMGGSYKNKVVFTRYVRPDGTPVL